MKKRWTTIYGMLCMITILACASLANAEVSREQLHELTAAMQELKADWTAEKTVNLLNRSKPDGTSTYSLETGDGEKSVLSVINAESILLNGKNILGAQDKSEKEQKPLTMPPLSTMIIIAVLSILLLISIGVNVLLLRGSSSRRGYPRSEVIRSISRL
ncbi:MAG: hypothetical protein ISS35_01125 [Kiritimatiellae bacterium]|nr:hypothetical protein [Kiritimatiellia bacterium]